jgi:hypothetical protein
LGVAAVSQAVVNATRLDREAALQELRRQDAIKLMNHDDDDDDDVVVDDSGACPTIPELSNEPKQRRPRLSISVAGVNGGVALNRDRNTVSVEDYADTNAFGDSPCPAPGTAGGEMSVSGKAADNNQPLPATASASRARPSVSFRSRRSINPAERDAAEAATMATFVAEMRQLLADDPIGVIGAATGATPMTRGLDVEDGAVSVDSVLGVNVVVDRDHGGVTALGVHPTSSFNMPSTVPLAMPPTTLAPITTEGWHRGLVLFDSEVHAANDAVNRNAQLYYSAMCAIRAVPVVLPQQHDHAQQLLRATETAFAALPAIVRATCPLAMVLKAAQSPSGMIEMDHK